MARRSSGVEIVLVGAVLVAVVLVAHGGAYLLAIGALGALAWLIGHTRCVASEPSRELQPSRDAYHSREAPESYIEVGEIDPLGLETDDGAVESAKEVFVAWTKCLQSAPRNISPFLRGIVVERRRVGRLSSTVAKRELVERRVPYRGSERAHSPRNTAKDLDAWDALSAGDSRYVARCDSCDGDGTVSCLSCGGSAEVRCRSCDGGGKSYQIAKNGSRRLMNCTDCKKKGKLPCSVCATGSVLCGSCDGAGQFECWLEVSESRRQDIQVEPDGAVTRAFAWGRDGCAVEHGAVEKGAVVVVETFSSEAITAAAAVELAGEEWVAAFWAPLQPELSRPERIVGQRFELLDILRCVVTYGVAREVRRVAFEGLRLLAPERCDDDLFQQRRRMLRASVAVAALAPPLLCFGTLLRGPFFVQPAIGVSVGLIAAAFWLGFLAVWRASLNDAFASRWAWATTLPLLLGVACAIAAEPRTSHVEASLANSRFEEARAELLALGEEDAEGFAELWAAYRLHQVRTATDLSTKEDSAARIPESQHGFKAEAQALVDAALRIEATERLAREELLAARSSLDRMTDSARLAAKSERLALSIAESVACERDRNWKCALERASTAEEISPEVGGVRHEEVVAALNDAAVKETKAAMAEPDLARQVDRWGAAISLWQELTPGDPRSSNALDDAVRRHGRASAALSAKRIADERRRIAAQAREDRRRHAAEARERARAEAEAEREARRERQRQWLFSPLRCCDGSLSPSCTHGSGSRGCCSRHGGVCG